MLLKREMVIAPETLSGSTFHFPEGCEVGAGFLDFLPPNPSQSKALSFTSPYGLTLKSSRNNFLVYQLV